MKRIYIIALVVLFLVSILLIVGDKQGWFLASDNKQIKEENEETEEENEELEEEEELEEKSYWDYYTDLTENNKIVKTINLYECESWKCTYKIDINSQFIPVIYERELTDDNMIHKLIVNSKTIFNEEDGCGGPSSLNVINDTYVVGYHYGCDVTGDVIKGYSISGNELFSVEYLDEEYKEMYIKDYEVNTNSGAITVEGTRLFHGPSIILGNSFVEFCYEEEREQHNITKDTVAGGIYKITYLGNNVYSKPILDSYIKLESELNNCTN